MISNWLILRLHLSQVCEEHISWQIYGQSVHWVHNIHIPSFDQQIIYFDLEDFFKPFREGDVDEEVDRAVDSEEQVTAPYE